MWRVRSPTPQAASAGGRTPTRQTIWDGTRRINTPLNGRKIDRSFNRVDLEISISVFGAESRILCYHARRERRPSMHSTRTAPRRPAPPGRSPATVPPAAAEGSYATPGGEPYLGEVHRMNSHPTRRRLLLGAFGATSAALIAAATVSALPAHAAGSIRNAGAANAVAGSYLVILKDGVSTQSSRSLADRHNAKITYTYKSVLHG